MNKPYKEGTSLHAIISDGWSRGFQPQQTLEELHTMGYGFATLQGIKDIWASMEEHMVRDFKKQECNGCDVCTGLLGSSKCIH